MRTPQARTVYAMGYKYCRTKVILFLFNEGAGHTECKPEYCYEAKWKDVNLNTRIRKVDRPHVAWLYFSKSNEIDILNQARQFELRLEKHWITRDGFSRIVTTLFGICVVDVWMGYKWHCHTNHRHKNMPLLQLADLLSLDCLNNPFSKASTLDTSAHSIVRNSIPDVINYKRNSSAISTITVDTEIAYDAPNCSTIHNLERGSDLVTSSYTNSEGESVQSKRTLRSRCKVCQMKTAWFCVQCSEKVN